jgi:hypothetical protein
MIATALPARQSLSSLPPSRASARLAALQRPSCPRTLCPADGQWLFLYPLNLRMLLAHFGSYPACPPGITAKVGGANAWRLSWAAPVAAAA